MAGEVEHATEEEVELDADHANSTTSAHLDDKVSKHFKDLEDKFSRMISTITKTFYEKVSEVSQITGGFEMLTKMQFSEWEEWRGKFSNDMKELKTYLSASNGNNAEMDNGGIKVDGSSTSKALHEKLTHYTAILDDKFTNTICCITNDFEDKIVDVTDIIRNFETQTRTQITELNRWRMQFENEIRNIKEHLCLLPYDGSKINNNTACPPSAIPRKFKDPLSRYTDKKSTKGHEMPNRNILSTLDDLRRKVTAIQNKVNEQQEYSSRTKESTLQHVPLQHVPLQHNTERYGKKKKQNTEKHIMEESPAAADTITTDNHTTSKKMPSASANKLPTFDYGVKKLCGKLDEIEQLIIDENNVDNLKYALIRVGTNDMEHKNVNQVYEEINSIIKRIREKYNDVVIILSEVMSKDDERADDVKRCNDLINKHYNNMENIFIRKVTSL